MRSASIFAFVLISAYRFVVAPKLNLHLRLAMIKKSDIMKVAECFNLSFFLISYF